MVIICEQCDKEVSYEDAKPDDCPFCWSQLTGKAEAQTIQEIESLTIVYEITRQSLNIPASHKIVLGREHYGSSFFSNILYNGEPIISRKHCSIELKDNQYYLLDEGSRHGTFYGTEKLSCKESAHIIHDKGIFFMGKEIFRAHIQFKDTTSPPDPVNMIDKTEQIRAVVKYRCNECEYESESNLDECPRCHTHKSLHPVYA